MARYIPIAAAVLAALPPAAAAAQGTIRGTVHAPAASAECTPSWSLP